MSLGISYSGKIAATNQKKLTINTKGKLEVDLSNFVICYTKTKDKVDIESQFKISYRLPTITLSNETL